MKIVFLVNHDIAALLALNILLPELANHETQILFTRKTHGAAATPKALACLAKFDAKMLAASRKLSSFEDLGAVQSNDINEQDFGLLASASPDLIISIRHMSILRQACIDLPKHGVINLHSGKLPNYKGVMASFWAMLQQQSELATTLHWIEDANIDTGQVIARSSTKADYTKSYILNVLNLYRGGCNNILAAIDSLSRGEALITEPQTNSGNYFSYPSQIDIDKAAFRLFSSSDDVDLFL